MNDLNEIQKQAVLYNSGASLIVAGAGSGKTRVLTYKIAYLLQNGVDPYKIMALTFTNKAAKEMKERIAQLVGKEEADKIKMGTFHSVFAQILKFECYEIGWNSRFSIYDEADCRNLIKDIIQELSIENDKYKPANVHQRISMAKNNLINPDDYTNDKAIQEEDVKAKMQMIGTIYSMYQNRLKIANAMDFDDLLFNTFKLFSEKPIVSKYYQDKYDFVLVDEFQDTNYVQMQILLQLCSNKNNLYAVGDDAQSIYGFRGANINNILSFQATFKNAQVFKLEQNYRSTQNIVSAANSLIHQNINQIPKNVFSQGDKGDKVHFIQLPTDRDEAWFLMHELKAIMRAEGCRYSDFTFLYRNNAQSRCIEEALMRDGIPYIVHGGISFFQRKEVKDVMAYLRLTCNCDDNEAFKRVINFPPRGIGNVTIQKIKDRATTLNVPMLHVAGEPEAFKLNVSSKTKEKLKEFANKINEYALKVTTLDAETFANELVNDFGVYEYLNGVPTDGITKINNVNEIFSSIQTFMEMRKKENRNDEIFIYNYLQDVALLADEQMTEDTDRVNLMTIHASKGLEFDSVFIVAIEEGIFPSSRTASSVLELEEERRLMYVAMTRAKKHLFLTCAKKRWLYGEMQENKPSRFINDIDPSYIDDMTENDGQDDGLQDCLFI